MEVSDVLYGSINFGQDASARQVQHNQISFDCWVISVFTMCQESSVVMPADIEAALLQAGTPIAGATPALRKDKPGAFLIAFFRCMNTWFCKLFLNS